MSYYNLPKFKAFRFWCQKVLPLVYDDSLSYYEVLEKVVHGLNLQADVINEIEDILEGSGIDIDEAVEKVIEKLEEEGIIETEVANAIAQAITDGDIDERCEYVVNQMITDGDLDTYVDGQISDYITGGSADSYIEGLISAETANKIKQYDTFSNIPSSGLTAGEIIRTKGYYTVGDKGASFYQVRALSDNYFPVNSGYSFKIIDTVTPFKCGARANSNYDDSDVFNSMLGVYRNIYIDNATYYFEDSIDIPASNTIIKSDRAILQRTNYNNKTLLVSSGRNNVEIDNVIFDGGEQSALSMLVSIINGANILVRNCVFRNAYGYALRFSGNDRSVVEQTFFENITGGNGNPGGAIYQQGGNRMFFRNLYGTNMQDHLVYLDGSVKITHVVVDSCIVTNNDISGALANAGVVALYGDCSDVSISNLECTSVKNGIVLAIRNNVTPKDVRISNCSFRQIAEEGIIVTGNGTPCYLNIENCTFYDITQDGISIRTATIVCISNCTFESCQRYGVGSSGSANIVTTGCLFRNCNIGIIHGFDESSSNIAIHGCMFINGTNGIYLRSGAQGSVSGVIFIGTFSSNPCSIAMVNIEVTGVPLSEQRGRSIFWSSTVPSVGYHMAGEIALDSTGVTKGWKCTVTGGPGTWVAIE